MRLARKVADALGLPPPDPRAAAGRAGFRHPPAEPSGATLDRCAALSLEGVPTGIASRQVAILVASGVEVGAMKVLQQALHEAGAQTRVLASHLGVVTTSSGQQLLVDQTFSSAPSALFDAVMVPAGAASADSLCRQGEALNYVLEAYRHGKTLCLIGEGARLLAAHREADAVPGVVRGRNDPTDRLPMAQAFIQAISRHRHWGRAQADMVPD